MVEAQNEPDAAILRFSHQQCYNALWSMKCAMVEPVFVAMKERHPVSLYMHIPFCQQKCAYCDFCSYAGLSSLYPAYVDALAREVALHAERWPDAHLRTVYIGGGTPTALPSALLASLIQSIRERFRLLPGAEITIEANPGTVDEAYLDTLRQAEVTRLSLGVQSFDDALLQAMGRIHNARQAVDTVSMARQAGLDSISLDLIYGWPGQSLGGWKETLAQACALEPAHLSLYALSVHQDTPLYQRIRAGDMPSPDDDLAADMYEWALDLLPGEGYTHYEISNWARSVASSERAAICQHNMTYWRDEPYLGLGAGAHGYLEDRRYWNVPHPQSYIHRLANGQWPVEGQERIDSDTEMAEFMILGLRLVRGVSRQRFRHRFHRQLQDVFGQPIREWVGHGLLHADEKGIRLTRRGYLLGNQVFEAFLPEENKRE